MYTKSSPNTTVSAGDHMLAELALYLVLLLVSLLNQKQKRNDTTRYKEFILLV